MDSINGYAHIRYLELVTHTFGNLELSVTGNMVWYCMVRMVPYDTWPSPYTPPGSK